jgi:hypothetical protein
VSLKPYSTLFVGVLIGLFAVPIAARKLNVRIPGT